MKKGIYASYQGHEYKATKGQGPKQIILMSPIAEEGFEKDRLGNYAKTVSIHEIESAYEVTTMAVYGGRTFSANRTKEGQLLLMHLVFEGIDEALELGFKMVEPGLCEKLVEFDEIDQLVEEKKPVWGFK